MSKEIYEQFKYELDCFIGDLHGLLIECNIKEIEEFSVDAKNRIDFLCNLRIQYLKERRNENKNID